MGEMRPRLRPLDFQQVEHEGQPLVLLRDPLELAEHRLLIPLELAMSFMFMDGLATVAELQVALGRYLGAHTPLEAVVELVAALDEAFLLDNERSRQALADRAAAYRAQPWRPPALAGLAYPAERDDLREVLTAFGAGDDLDGWRPWRGRAVIAPHIDYLRGGRVYAQVWRRAEAAVREAELVLIFGTDHSGRPGQITLTAQPYATPYGVLPGDAALVAELAGALGPDAFADELHHHSEHSVELSAVWLHHLRPDDPPPMVPILCGSFEHFVANGHHPDEDGRLNAFVEALRAATAGRRVLAVASVDLAHVGPSFGDGFAMDPARREQLAASDASLIAAICAGDSRQFYSEVARVQDRNRICGFSSIYLLLRYLGGASGQQVAYAHCPADAEDASLVSICGVLLG